MSEYIVVVRLTDANIEAIDLRGSCRVEIPVISEEEAYSIASKYGYVSDIYTSNEIRGLSEKNKKLLTEIAFYRVGSRNEEIYTYYICEKCKSYMTHQNVWCSQCGSKYIAKKGRASEFEKDGYEDAYSLFSYRKHKECGFFEVSIQLKSKVNINLKNGKIKSLENITCRVSLGIKELSRHKAVEIGAKYGDVYHCRYNRGDEKFFGIMINT